MFLSLREGLVACAAARRAATARRVPARRPGHFHLLAQMKVTKAKGPELKIWLADVARDPRRLMGEGGPGRAWTVAVTAKEPEMSCRSKWIELPELRQGVPLLRATADRQQPNPLAGRSGQIVLRPFALVTFIWASK